MVYFSRRRTGTILVASGLLAIASLATAEDGYRPVEPKGYGIAVQTPVAWRLSSFGDDKNAFVLMLPQDEDAPRAGLVSCQLELYPDSLEEIQKGQQAADDEEQKKTKPSGKLTLNTLELLNKEKYGKEKAEQLSRRLISQWDHEDADGSRWFEIKLRVVCEDALYTFSLNSDESHFDAYRLDFEDMFKSAKFTAFDTGLQKSPVGEWLQKKYRFALKLPAGWKPTFGANDKVPFLATGNRAGAEETLVVLARPAAALDVDKLKDELPAQIQRDDAQADAACRIVPQGNVSAVETVIHTRRGPREVTILERRFRGEYRNYELQFECATSAFEKRADEFRKTLDSFHELAESQQPGVL